MNSTYFPPVRGAVGASSGAGRPHREGHSQAEEAQDVERRAGSAPDGLVAAVLLEFLGFHRISYVFSRCLLGILSGIHRISSPGKLGIPRILLGFS